MCIYMYIYLLLLFILLSLCIVRHCIWCTLGLGRPILNLVSRQLKNKTYIKYILYIDTVHTNNLK